MSLIAINTLPPAVALVNFKRNLLSLDLQSRKFLLQRCVEYIQSESPEEYPERNTLLTWFDKCITLTEVDIQTDLRKSEIKSPEFWNVIFELHNSPILWNIITHTSRLG